MFFFLSPHITIHDKKIRVSATGELDIVMQLIASFHVSLHLRSMGSGMQRWAEMNET